MPVPGAPGCCDRHVCYEFIQPSMLQRPVLCSAVPRRAVVHGCRWNFKCGTGMSNAIVGSCFGQGTTETGISYRSTATASTTNTASVTFTW
jgi:hypothetical protein